jgi:predicted small secreted protein
MQMIGRTRIALLVVVSLLLGGCNANVGVGVSVGIPVGNHGHVSVGATRWR